MNLDSKKYFVDSSFKKFDQDKWLYLLNKLMPLSEFVEFNILIEEEFENFVKEYKNDLIEIGKKKNKVYASGSYARFRLSENIKEFILERDYPDWNCLFLEDISLIADEVEILSTITHENYVILFITVPEANEYNKQGFDFKFFLDLEELTK